MSMKHCSRCYFAVQRKRRLCDKCGNREFISVEATEQPLDESSSVYQFAKAIGLTWREVKDDLLETAHKSVRATRQVIALVRGVEDKEAHDERKLSA